MSEVDDFIEEIRTKASRTPGIPADYINTLLRVLANATDRKRLMEKIRSLVEPRYNNHMLKSKNPVLSFPSKEDSVVGGVKIGYVCAGDQVLYPIELTNVNLTENIFGVGRAGSGKSTFLTYFIDQLHSHNIRFTVIDWKNDYTFLAKKYDDVPLLVWNQLSFNPWTNVPPGMDRTLWWSVVLDVIAHSTGLYVATPSHILEALDEVYEGRKGMVTTKDLEQYLRSQKETGKRSEYSDVAINRITLLNRVLDPVINVNYGFDIEELFKSNCVIQMSPLHQAVASFLFQVLVLWEYYRRLYNNIRGDWKSTPHRYFIEKFHIFIMDEAHLTQYSGQEANDLTFFSPPPLSTFFSQSRELGLATCAFTQFPNLVMSAFKINASTRIFGGIIESDIRRELAASIGLERDQENLLWKTDKGIWLVNIAGRTKKPFVMQTPFVEKPIVAEAEVFSNSKRFLTAMQMKRQEIESKMFLNDVQKHDPDKVHLPELPEEAWQVLQFVFDHEFAYQKQISDGIGLSPHKLDDMKKMLLSKNLIRIETFPVFTHNRTHYVLTAKTLDVFKTLGKSPQRIAYWKFLSTNPGYYHRYFQFLFMGMHRRLGWKGSVERDLPNGRRVDIFMQREVDGKRKVIELETSTIDISNKVRVILDGYCDELVLLYKDMAGVQLARSKLEKIDGIVADTIWVGQIRDYVELLAGITKAQESAGNGDNPGNSTHGTSGNGKQPENGVEGS